MTEQSDDLMTTYMDAGEQFGKSAKEFLQHLNLLPKALNDYQQAMSASAELRKLLDNRDEMLRTLMAQLEAAVQTPLSKLAFDEKKTEGAEGAKATSAAAGIGIVKTFP
jgi:hypothetical protein